MHEPIGVSGVQSVPNNLQSAGFFTPRKIAPHSQAGLSLAATVWMSKTFSASNAA